MILMYLAMGIVNCKNVFQCIKLLVSLIEQNSQGNIGDAGFMMPQLKLKYRILCQFLALIFGYFLLKVILYLTVISTKNEIFVWKFATAISAIDLVFFGGILVIFRPRIWPQFYSIGINEL
jgi:hypothetical protein